MGQQNHNVSGVVLSFGIILGPIPSLFDLSPTNDLANRIHCQRLPDLHNSQSGSSQSKSILPASGVDFVGHSSAVVFLYTSILYGRPFRYDGAHYGIF